MRFNYGKKGALCAVCLIVGIICITIFSLRVQAAEENGIPQPASVKLYRDMSDNSNIIANLIVGNVFEVVGSENDSSGSLWYRVKTDFGMEGYVKASEFDKLITDAQAMMNTAAANSESEVPTPEGEQNEGEYVPDGDNPTPAENGADAEPLPDAESANAQPIPEEEPAGPEPAHIDSRTDEELVPEEDDIVDELFQEGDNSGEAALTPEESSVMEAVSESSAAGQEETSKLASGAGFGEVNSTEISINSDGFTVIERTDQPKERVHGKIDAVLIMIIAGGILCIIAIAALLKRLLICVRTKA